MDVYTVLEIISVILGVLYLILMVKENIWCWIFGIISSAITIYLYIHVTLYLEAGLNFYYILAGFYGWMYWHKHHGKNQKTPVIEWRLKYHLINITSGIALSLILGYTMHQFTDSHRPYIDATITVFSFSATYLEARKVISTWYYWFFLNAFSVGLMIDRELYFFSALSVFYTVMCIYGFIHWRKTLREQKEDSAISTPFSD
jgi:nicotinamide mononucleotide transporter